MSVVVGWSCVVIGRAELSGADGIAGGDCVIDSVVEAFLGIIFSLQKKSLKTSLYI